MEKLDVAMAKAIELWPLESLRPYAKNARTHSEEQVAKIAASIAEFGFVNPILVDSQHGIIAGHGRMMAAKKLGLGRVPVVVLDHLSESQRKAYILADNRLALDAGWDMELLAEELAELESEGMDLELTGFSKEELEKFLGADAAEIEMPELRSGEKTSFAQMTFTLTEEQKQDVERAITQALDMGEFGETGNKNRNGNALARIVEFFMTMNRPEIRE